MDQAQWQAVIDLNLSGVFYTSKAAFSKFIASTITLLPLTYLLLLPLTALSLPL